MAQISREIGEPLSINPLRELINRLRQSEEPMHPALEFGVDMFEPSTVTPLPIPPVNMAKWLPTDRIPRFQDMWHGRGPTGARAVARDGIQTAEQRGVMEPGATRNASKQLDAAYLASDPAQAEQYGDFIFKLRADPSKFRPDDDFIHALIYNQAIVDMWPGHTLLNREMADTHWRKKNNPQYKAIFDIMRRKSFKDFLSDPGNPQYKQFINDSIDEFGQVAHEGSIAPNRLRGVSYEGVHPAMKKYPSQMTYEDAVKESFTTPNPYKDDLLPELQQILRSQLPAKLRREY